MQNLILIQALSCFFLTGLIWTVQLVHYPTFFWIDKDKFKEFEAFHSFRISLIVMPLMILELITALLITSFFLTTDQVSFFNLNFIATLLIWGSTFFLSVPCHSKLSLGYSKVFVNRLVITNWIRTLLWTARSLSWLFFLVLNAELNI